MQQDTEVMERVDVIGTLFENRAITRFRFSQAAGLMMIEGKGEGRGELIHGGWDRRSGNPPMLERAILASYRTAPIPSFMK